MPIYEYTCEDGTTLELIRPMSQADAPVEDPDGKGRTFTRKHSTFSAGSPSSDRALPTSAGCCPCGKTTGGCGMGS
jgi:putative FmdB family regulatory protein